MKIGEVKAGEEYAAHDNPTRTYGGNPRQVKAISIDKVTNPKGRWNGYTGTWSPLTKTKIKVSLLGPVTSTRSWGDPIGTGKAGTTILVDARNLVAKWSDIAPALAEKLEQERKEDEAREALKTRVRALLGKTEGWRVTNYRHTFEIELRDKSIDKLLTLAEKGKAS